MSTYAKGRPMVIAITKCDKKNADPEKVKLQLIQRGVPLDEAGGDVQCIEVSSAQGTNIPLLAEAIALSADMSELFADDTLPAGAIVLGTYVFAIYKEI